MKTLKEMMKVMEHFDNGGKVEYKRTNGSTWGIINDPTWDWNHFDYRIKEGPKIDWLKTGWVQNKNNIKRIINAFHEDSDKPYRVNGIWYSEKDMNEYFTPCESPIGK
jgi:hypothetical protein